MQIFILNSDERVVGTLTSNTGSNLASPFFEDEYSMDLHTGAETFTFKTFSNIPQAKNIVVGNYVAFQYKEETKLFQITSVTDEHNTEFVKTVYCEMAGIELINSPLRPREYPSVNLKQFVTSVLSDTDWKVGSIDSRITEVHTLELTDYTTVYSALQEHVINTFGGEISFRVIMKNGKIAGKYVDVFLEKGTFDGFRFSYHKNVDNVVRTVDSSELATALIGVGNNNIDFKEVNATDKPKNQDFIADEESYKQWNKNGSHIFGISQHDTDDPATLLSLTRKDLEKRKNPKISYELSVGYFDYEELDIGDTVYCVDNEFSPPLHLSARVNQLVVSFTDRDKNACILANFKEVQSKITDELRQLASIIDSKFPIGSDQIKDGAVNGDKITQGAVSGNHVAHDTLIADHIKANQIKTDHLEANSITSEKIKANEIKTDHLQANSVTTEKLQANVVTADKIQAGSIVGDHLTSNLIDATHIKADQIEANHIKSESINTNHLSANSITTDKLQANSISTDKLQANSISTDKLQANSIEGTHIKGETITGDKIVGNSIEGTHIKGETITGTHITGDSIVGNHVQANTIEGRHLKADIIQGDHIIGGTIEGEHIKGETIEGTHIKGDTITGNHIQSNSINTGHLNANTIKGEHIQGSVITGNHIQANTIGTNHLEANSISTDKLQAQSIDTVHLKAEIIESSHIKSETITADKIASNTITGNEIQGNTITGNHIQGNTIGAGHIQAGAIGSNQIQTGALTSDKMVIADGFIKNAMIDSIVASKISSGEIDTSKVRIQSPNGNITIADSTQQFRDAKGNVRVQIGQDNNGDFTFVLLDESGQGVLIDHTGLKEKAIADGLIKNNMIGDGQIDGKKVDINSIITKVNTDGTESFLASKILMDATGQKLDVSFSQINNKVSEVDKKIDDLEISGRNLIKGTSSSYKEVTMGEWNYPLSDKLTLSDLGLSTGDEITLSFYAKVPSNSPASIYPRFSFYKADGTYTSPYGGTPINPNTEGFTAYTDKIPSDCTAIQFCVQRTGAGTGATKFNFQYKFVKAEKGNKATDWSPAPEDLNEKIEVLDTNFSIQQGKIEGLISNTTIEKDGTTTTLKDAHSKLEQTVNGISSTVSETTTKLNNLSIGGRNLIRKANLGTNNSSGTFDEATNTWTITATAGQGGAWGCGLVVKNKDVVIPYGKSYVLSFEIFVPRACNWNIDVNNYALTGSSWGGNDNDLVSSRKNSSKSLIANQWIKCWSVITNTNTNNTNKVDLYDVSNFGVVMQNETSNMTYKIRNVMGEIGNVPSEWTPAPEDTEAEVSHAMSLIEQNAKDITMKVDVDGVISAIALDESGVKISGEKIDLEGLITIKSLNDDLASIFGEEFNKTVIDGGRIKTGSVTAQHLNAKGLSITDDNNLKTFSIDDGGNVSLTGEIISSNFSDTTGEEAGYHISKDGDAIFNQATLRGSVILPSAGITNYGGKPLNQLTGTKGTFTSTSSQYNFKTFTIPKDLNGKTVTLSFKGRTVAQGTDTVMLGYIYENSWTKGSKSLGTTANKMDWEQKHLTYTIPSGTDQWYASFYNYKSSNGGVVEVKDIVLVEGSVGVNEWCPHSSEIGNQVRFWAGASYEDREQAMFRVLQDGSVYATKGHFNGTFSGRVEVGDIVIEDQDKGYIEMKDNSKNRVIYLGEDEVSFKPSVKIGDDTSSLNVNSSSVYLENKSLQVTKKSGNTTKTVFKVNENSDTFLELNGTHSLKTTNDTMEVVGNHTKFSNDVTVSGDLSTENMVVGKMRMERKTDTGNIGVDFIFI